MTHQLPTEAVSSIKRYLLGLQNAICKSFITLDGKESFHEDVWKRPEGGGITRILTNGNVFEKVGVNFSHVFGSTLPPSASTHRGNLAGYGFQALGVSLVTHPYNPYVPTSHANVRFFLAEKPGCDSIWWFGGGFDLTPYYGFVDDCQHWHKTAKQACDPFGDDIYPRLKHWCDTYFYIKHRQEARGIGGLFFDDYCDPGFEKSFGLMQSIGSHYLPAYEPIVARRKHHPFNAREKAFQHYRRGRYAEFNLVYDRGTLFGLQSGGRTESILMSLPPIVHWTYDWHPEENSPELALYTDFLPARDWV